MLSNWNSIWLALASFGDSRQKPLQGAGSHVAPSQIAFSKAWSVLGPWQIGTREASWGSDPLERHGGFRALEHDPAAVFRSSLAINGTIKWSNITAELSDPSGDRQSGHAGAALNINFPHTPWQNLTDVYGWAALQWQAWVRGEIIITSSDTELLTLYTPGLLEFRVDDVHYFGGDFYSYQRVPVTLRLSPGKHRMDARVVRDVRVMGGIGEPFVQLHFDLRKTTGGLQPVLPPLLAVLISDFIGDRQNAVLASPHASTTVRNDAEEDIVITDIKTNQDVCVAELTSQVRLVPGQTRPVPFKVRCTSSASRLPFLHFDIGHTVGTNEQTRILSVVAGIRISGKHGPQKVTYLHQGGVVSYAVLRPPSLATIESYHNRSFPVLLGLHGAGVEADGDGIRHAMDEVPDLKAWTLFPTGVTPWSGDDWHVWGSADVEAAVAAIPCWIEELDWRGPAVDINKWLVIGHSNGGQGAWYTLLHKPNKVFAAAPLSGYSSIQNYVTYQFWSTADPGRTAIVQTSLISYRHEQLLSNAKGIPVLQQHGGEDDNVPPYHSRLMAQLIQEAGADSQYNEVAGKPHYWNGVHTTYPLKDFYREQLAVVDTVVHVKTPLKMHEFTLTVANPGDTGPKHGVEVLQLAVPGRIGRIDVLFDPLTLACTIRTTGIRMFALSTYFRDCSSILIDDQKFPAATTNIDLPRTITFKDSQWTIEDNTTTTLPTNPERRGRQLGAMDAILHTHGAFQIVKHSTSKATSHVALQISRNFAQYYAADTVITSSYEDAKEATGNIISIAHGDDLPLGYYKDHPIQVSTEGVYIRGGPRYLDYSERGLAAIFLRPLPLGRLELVVWTIDEASLHLAARLVPMMTGVGQPDFVVMDKTMLWKGLEGTLALGFFDHAWQVSRNSFLS